MDVPEEAPQAVEAFFQRFQLVDAASGARIILTLALDGMPADGLAPVILDMDVFPKYWRAREGQFRWSVWQGGRSSCLAAN